MAIVQQISLTQRLNVGSGSHILYFYSSQDSYVQNAVSFIKAGIDLKQHVVLIDSEERYACIRRGLQEQLNPEEYQYVHYINNFEFYRLYDDFHFERVLENLAGVIQPYLDEKIEIRLWGHVDWREQDNIQNKLHTYECECDITLEDLGYLTVCAYSANRVPASIQIEMMRSHEYLMTDQEIIVSNLYRKRKQFGVPTPFPTLSAQTALESEMDLYKQKLDFVHVVSHEVRNPLTVIKAYASLLLNKTDDPQDQQKLQSICDYVMEIDHEITHIINTEQMLSTDSLWRKKIILPYNLLKDVIEIMEVKGRTQNIKLRTLIRMTGAETILGNAIGFKLTISNLISNAIKYSHEGETVMLIAEMEEGKLRIVVEDQGIGMSAEQTARLFRKYEKMNEERGGQGIGLFMVKKLVDHFEGTIDVQSELNVGTRITVCFPSKITV